jgi:hypothetical protein
MHIKNSRLVLTLFCAFGCIGQANALTLGTDFSSYTAVELGSITGLPTNYGGLTFKAGDINTIIIGGNANNATGRFYEVGVVRDGSGHITGFGAPVQIGGLGEYNDGGIAYGPGGVLFTSRWPVNELGQTKPGSTDEDKIIDLAALGVANSHAALNFVPAGFAGAGDLKLVSWSGGQWYTASLTPDGSGTYDVAVTQVDLDPVAAGVQNVPGGPEGFVFIDGANAGFGGIDSMLIAEWSVGNIGAYELDANGNPLVSTRRDFITGLSGAEGAVIDPLTGDFIFSTFGGGNHLVRVSGFIEPPPPPPPVPEPASLALLGIGLAGLGVIRRRKPS